jgi:hypothetical protein
MGLLAGMVDAWDHDVPYTEERERAAAARALLSEWEAIEIGEQR